MPVGVARLFAFLVHPVTCARTKEELGNEELTLFTER